MKCVPVGQLLLSKKYVLKRNPWMEINPEKAHSECILAKSPYFSKAWGGTLPPEVAAMAGIAKWAMKQLANVTVDARTDIIGYYMEFMHDWLEGHENPTKEELEAAMRECLKKAIENKLGEEFQTLEAALEAAKTELKAVKKEIRLSRKLKKSTLENVAKLVRVR